MAQWQKLWEKADDVHFFNSPKHLISFLSVFPSEKYLIIFCYKNEELVGVLPLVWGRRFGIKTLMCADSFGDSVDRSSLCLDGDDPKIFRQMVEDVTKTENLYLAELEERHLNLFMQNNGEVAKNCVFEFSCISPRVILGDDPLVNMSRKTRKKFKKKLQKTEKIITFEFCRSNNVADFQKMIEIEKKSWKGKKKISLFEKEVPRRVYSSWVKMNDENIGISFLKHEGKEIAYLFGIFSKNTFLVTNTAFVSDAGKMTPGTILVFRTLEYLQNIGIEMVDFSVGDSRWKREFGNRFLKQYNFYFSRNKAVYHFWMTATLCKKIVKKILGKEICAK